MTEDINVLELIQCSLSGIWSGDDRSPALLLVNETGHAQVTGVGSVRDVLEPLQDALAVALQDVREAPVLALARNQATDSLVLVLQCADRPDAEFAIRFDSAPRFSQPLATLCGRPDKVELHTADESMVAYFESLASRANISIEHHHVSPASDGSARTQISQIRILDLRRDPTAGMTQCSEEKTIALLLLADLPEHDPVGMEELHWPFFDSDLIYLLAAWRQQSTSVLIADDSKPSLMATRVMLERLGCEVTVAEDGREALELAMEQVFDLIFLDERMPELYGSEVALQLSSNENPNTHTTKISLTGVTEPDAVEALYRNGINFHIEKPVSKLRLEEFLKQWRGNSSPSGQTV